MAIERGDKPKVARILKLDCDVQAYLIEIATFINILK